MDYSEKWGVDVEEAVKLALIDLKLSRDEVEVTILEEPSKGFFGIGSKLAKVRVEKKKREIFEKQQEIFRDKKQDRIQERPANKSKSRKERVQYKDQKSDERNVESKTNKRELAANLDIEVVDRNSLRDVEDHKALDFLRGITEKMGLSLNLKAKADEETVYLELEGKDSGTVIGKRGQTLDAIQYLTSLVVNKDSEKYIKVVVDAENYRAKRKKTLEQLANRLAGKVVKTKKYVRLEPMNPYERKIIHATLQQHPNITTKSEGEEPYRRVVIELKK